MSKFWIGLVLGVLFVPVIILIVVYLGLLPAAADDPSMRFEPLIAESGLFARIERQAPNRDVSGMSTEELLAGAVLYRNNCAACHALPGQAQGPVGTGMFPKAPQLLAADGMVTDDSAGETYWKVKNGIRLSGMPSFGAVLSEDQMWQVTAVVKRADKLPNDVMDALNPRAAAPLTVPPASPIPAKSKP
jgi:mono/diheme cytochrome c family protein